MSLTTLPNELFVMIADNLSPESLLSLMLCSQEFYALGNSRLKQHAINSPHYKTAALFWAAMTSNVGLIRLLLTAGAPISVVEAGANPFSLEVVCHQAPSHCDVRTALHVAGLGTKLLLDNTPKPPHNASPAIFWAVENSHIALLKLAIRCNADIEWQNHKGQTALHIALRLGHECEALFLLASGANFNILDANGYQPLEIAIERCHGVVEAILAYGADPDRLTYWGETVLHYAAKLGKVKVVKILLEHSANPNKVDVDQCTPLHRAAARKDSAEIVHMLLDNGADVSCINNVGRNSFELAESSGNLAAGALLKQLYITMPYWRHSGDCSYLHLAVRHSVPWLIKQVLALKVDVNARDKSGQTPLHLAATINRSDMASMLVDAGASVDALDDTGKTPLHIAAKIPGLVLFWELLMVGERMSFSLRDTVEGCTPLHLAAQTMVDPSGEYRGYDGAERNSRWSAIIARERLLFEEVMEKRRSVL